MKQAACSLKSNFYLQAHHGMFSIQDYVLDGLQRSHVEDCRDL